jgi:hypothetical protein
LQIAMAQVCYLGSQIKIGLLNANGHLTPRDRREKSHFGAIH